MTLLLFPMLTACGPTSVDTSSVPPNTDTADTADTADTTDTADTDTTDFVCDYSAIEGTWSGKTDQGWDQTITIQSAAEENDFVGFNDLFGGTEEPFCSFEMDCRVPIEGESYQVYNTVLGSNPGCAGGYYTFRPMEDGLQVIFHTSQGSPDSSGYKLRAK